MNIRYIFIYTALVASFLSFRIHADFDCNTTFQTNSKKLLKDMSLFYGTHMALSTCHESGHVLIAKLELVSLGRTSSKAFLKFNPFGASSEYPLFKNNSSLTALTAASGPLAGLLGSYITLKIANIYQEWTKNKDFKRALKDGFNKPLFNCEQSVGLQAAILFHIITNLIDLFIPFSVPGVRDTHAKEVLHALSRN